MSKKPIEEKRDDNFMSLLEKFNSLTKENPLISYTAQDIEKRAYLVQTFDKAAKPLELIGYFNGYGFNYTYKTDRLELQGLNEQVFKIAYPFDPETYFSKVLEAEICIVNEVGIFNSQFLKRLQDYYRKITQFYKEHDLGEPIGVKSGEFNQYTRTISGYLRNSDSPIFFEEKDFSDDKNSRQKPETPQKSIAGQLEATATDFIEFFKAGGTSSALGQIKKNLIFFLSNPKISPNHIAAIDNSSSIMLNGGFITFATFKLLDVLAELDTASPDIVETISLEQLTRPVKQGLIKNPVNVTFETNLTARQLFSESSPGEHEKKIKVATEKNKDIFNRLKLSIENIMTPFDQAVWEEYLNLKRTNPGEPITFLQIANALYVPAEIMKNGKPRKSQIRANSKLVKEVEESVKKLWGAEGELNFKPEIEFYKRQIENGKKNENAKKKLELLEELEETNIMFHYITGDLVFKNIKTRNGALQSGIIPSTSVTDNLFYEYLDVIGQRTSITKQLLPNPLQPTPNSILIYRYLAKQISGMPYFIDNLYLLNKKQQILLDYQDKKKTSSEQKLKNMPGYKENKKREQGTKPNLRTINIDKMIKELHLENSNRFRNCEDVVTILDCWKRNKLLANVKENRAGNKPKSKNANIKYGKHKLLSVTVEIF